MPNPQFEVSRVNSMQWNRTINAEIFSVLDDPARTTRAIPADVLAKVQDLLQKELSTIATNEIRAQAGQKQVKVDVKLSTK